MESDDDWCENVVVSDFCYLVMILVRGPFFVTGTFSAFFSSNGRFERSVKHVPYISLIPRF